MHDDEVVPEALHRSNHLHPPDPLQRLCTGWAAKSRRGVSPFRLTPTVEFWSPGCERSGLLGEDGVDRKEVAMAVERRARSVWTGTLTEGEGRLTAESSGVFADLPVTWASRTEEPGGKTSPEELLAAAHASCFSMALSSGLTKAGTPPERLEVTATATFQPGEGVTSMRLSVVGVVPEIEEEAFGQAAETAKENCPVSKALAGIP